MSYLPNFGVDKVVTRATGVLAQTGDVDIFSITGGLVKLKSITGVVTTVIQNQANDTLLKHDPDGAGATTDICAALDIDNDAVGTVYNITGTLANAMVASTDIAAIAQAGSVVLPPGDIVMECAASNTGSVRWSIVYQPLEEGATVVAV